MWLYDIKIELLPQNKLLLEDSGYVFIKDFFPVSFNRSLISLFLLNLSLRISSITFNLSFYQFGGSSIFTAISHSSSGLSIRLILCLI